MSKPEHEDDAVRVYRRTLGEVAGHQVVAAAEDVVGDAWIEELERFRDAVLDAAGSVRTADRTARDELRDELREARRRAGAGEITRAHQGLAAAREHRRIGLDEVCQVLEALDEELEHVCTAGIERARRGREELARLHAAWFAAYGQRPD